MRYVAYFGSGWEGGGVGGVNVGAFWENPYDWLFVLPESPIPASQQPILWD